MYKVGDVVIYGTEGICTITDTTEKVFDDQTIRYFILSPLGKETNSVFVPMGNEKAMSKMRPVISKSEAAKLINSLPCDALPWIAGERERQQTFKNILLYGKLIDILSMARALYLKQEEQYEKGKKLHASDERFLRDAERVIFDEVSYAYGIRPSEVLPLIIALYR